MCQYPGSTPCPYRQHLAFTTKLLFVVVIVVIIVIIIILAGSPDQG